MDGNSTTVPENDEVINFNENGKETDIPKTDPIQTQTEKAPIPYNDLLTNCYITRNFFYPEKEVITTLYLKNGSYIEGRLSYRQEVNLGDQVQYSCRDPSLTFRSFPNVTCDKYGHWSENPDNDKYRTYCHDPVVEEFRLELAKKISYISGTVILILVILFCCGRLVKRGRVKKQIRREALKQQDMQMHENMAYLENGGRFYRS